jgi:DNA end-binding protein Ku
MLKDKVTVQPLPAEDSLKAYKYDLGQFVPVDHEGFEKIKLKSEKVIDIDGLVDLVGVHPTLFESPFFVGHDFDLFWVTDFAR